MHVISSFQMATTEVGFDTWGQEILTRIRKKGQRNLYYHWNSLELMFLFYSSALLIWLEIIGSMLLCTKLYFDAAYRPNVAHSISYCLSGHPLSSNELAHSFLTLVIKLEVLISALRYCQSKQLDVNSVWRNIFIGNQIWSDKTFIFVKSSKFFERAKTDFIFYGFSNIQKYIVLYNKKKTVREAQVVWLLSLQELK